MIRELPLPSPKHHLPRHLAVDRPGSCQDFSTKMQRAYVHNRSNLDLILILISFHVLLAS